jgi:hypothetical protein
MLDLPLLPMLMKVMYWPQVVMPTQNLAIKVATMSGKMSGVMDNCSLIRRLSFGIKVCRLLVP